MSSELQIFESILRECGHSVTTTRQQIFQTMLGHYPMTIKELSGKLPHINRSSIYRSITLFESINVVNRIQLGWKYKLELSDKFSPHHHHINCIACGEIKDVPASAQIEKALEELLASQKFTPLSHQFEVNGICASCKTKNPELLPGVSVEVSHFQM